MSLKPLLAIDWIESAVKFPCIVQPKIDGVRGVNLTGMLTGRSLKCHANRFTTNLYSRPEYFGFDGEIVAERETHPDLCRLTTSALNTIEGEPYTHWHIFDCIDQRTITLPYIDRLIEANHRIKWLRENGHLKLFPISYRYAHSIEELLQIDEIYLDLGYEGTIVRNPNALYKEGRAGKRNWELFRIKQFIEAEAIVEEILEGEENANEAQVNELGRQFRSSHQENMIPNGMVGSMMCRLLDDIIYRGEKLFEKGMLIKVSAGSMPHDDRVRFFKEQNLLLKQIIKFKMFPKGVKDKPRFPTYQCIRAASDL